ncbi:N-acetylmuramoyl-L-alanine amidase [Lysobacter fragariae]
MPGENPPAPATSSPGPILPDNSTHPDHARYQQVAAGVERLACWPPDQARNMAMALYAEVSRDACMKRVDGVVLGSPLANPQQVFALYRPFGNQEPSFLASAPVSAAQTPIAAGVLSSTQVDKEGYLVDPGIVRHGIGALEHGKLQGPHAIVMHRTGGANAASALASFATGTGTHFMVDKDGTIYQTASLEQKTHHVGKIRSRCFEEGTCEPAEQQALKALGFAPKAIHDREQVKPYPQRYPVNEDSIGIEVVARHTATGWESPTPQQRASIDRLVGILQQHYGLGDRDVYQHDVVSYKTQGEGAGLYQHGNTGTVEPPVVQPRGLAR